MKKSVAIALAASAFICGVLTIVSLASPDWVSVYTVDGQKAEIGLFEICAPIVGCLDVVDSDAFLQATKAFIIISTIAVCLNVVYCVLAGMKKVPAVGIPILFGVAALCALIAMAVFTGKQQFTTSPQFPNISSSSFGYSFALGWVAFGLDLILVVVSVILCKVSEYSVIP